MAMAMAMVQSMPNTMHAYTFLESNIILVDYSMAYKCTPHMPQQKVHVDAFVNANNNAGHKMQSRRAVAKT